MAYLIILLPLLGSILGYVSKSFNEKLSEIIPTVLVILSALFSGIIFITALLKMHMEIM